MNIRVEMEGSTSVLEEEGDSVVKEGIRGLAYVHRHDTRNFMG